MIPSDEGPASAEPPLPVGEVAVPVETPLEPSADDPLPAEPSQPTALEESTPAAEPIEAELVPEAAPLGELPQPLPRRRVALPVLLFICTCASTFFVGIYEFTPQDFFSGKLPLGVALLDADKGLLYMASVIGILLSHEMGHFVMTLRYRIPASLPFFIPVPIMLLGTMGAVIAMDGRKANRKEMFDMGLAGPLAGLVVCLPILVLGILQLKADTAAADPIAIAAGQMERLELHNPLLIEWLLPRLDSAVSVPHPQFFTLSQMNPLLMAGWFGLLITGLNMMPASQLDGGHVLYALFGRYARLIARGFLIGAIAYIIIEDRYIWAVMVILVTLIGVDHPPTADDTVPLGFWRRAIGYASLAIPVLCFPIRGIVI